MDIDEITSRCPHAANLMRTSFDQRILSNISYIASNDDEFCTDLEMLYNTVYSSPKENAYGSSDRYTVPPFLDVAKNREHFVKNNKCDCDSLDFLNYMLPVVCFVMMVLTIIILIQRGTKLN